MSDQGYRDLRVLVLGASGFIGQWVTRKLCDVHANVILAVRRQSAAESLLSSKRIHGEFVEQDLQDSEGVRRLIRDCRPAVIFNLAGYGVDPAEQAPEMFTNMNVRLVRDITQGVAESRRINSTSSVIVHVGSAQEYGTARGNLEEGTVAQPTTIYGRTKLAGTMALAQECRALGLRGVTARLFTVYGPGEHNCRLLPSIREAKRIGSSLDLTAGRQLRDFTYVEDVADGLLRLGLADLGPGEIVNTATGQLTSVRDFAITAAQAIKLQEELLHFGALPTRPDEMNHAPVSVDRLRGLVGWIPSTTITDGIQRTLSNCRSESASQRPQLMLR